MSQVVSQSFSKNLLISAAFREWFNGLSRTYKSGSYKKVIETSWAYFNGSVSRSP